MKVAIYSRVSTSDKIIDPVTKKVVKKGQTTETQTNSLVDYCKRMNWEYEVFQEHASGKDMVRKQFQLMQEKLRKREFDILLVSKIDRLSRSVLDFCTFTIQLNSWGIRLIVLEQAIDTDKSNPMSQLLISILIAFAEFEREMIRDRTRRGIANARAKGKYIGGQRVKGLDEIEDLLITYHKHGRSSREIAKLLWTNYKVKVSNMTVHRRLVALGAIVPNQEPNKGGKVFNG
jgi:DNA invertase Pin-like site-specific DNA recombinase